MNENMASKIDCNSNHRTRGNTESNYMYNLSRSYRDM